MRQSKKVLVLGSDTRSFLSVVRSLGRGGLSVDSAWTHESSLARHSRYLRQIHDDLPAYTPADMNWMAALRERVEREGYDLVIPTSDTAILPLQNHRDRIDLRRFYLLSEQAFEITNDKSKTYHLAAKENVPVPAQALVRSVAEAERAAGEFGYPVILKPLTSFTLENYGRKQFVRQAVSRASLRQLLAPMLLQGAVAVQEFFRGIGVGVEVLASEGEVLASFQHQRVHEPRQGGGSSYRESVKVDPELFEVTKRLIKALNYTGVCMVEFRMDPSAGRFILVEINGRFWGSLPLAIAAGANFPLWLYQMWVEGCREFSREKRVGMYCRNLSPDVDWFIETARANSEGSRSAKRVLNEVASGIGHLLTLRERVDTLVLDDLKPGILELREIGQRLIDYAHRFFWSYPRLKGLRSLFVWKARRRLRHGKKIIFVCKGNICRSPFAARYAKRLMPELEIQSAGYYPAANRSSPSEAVRAAASFGIDLSQGRSSVVNRDMVRDVDAILLFDHENYVAMRNAYPDLTAKFVFLGALDGGPSFIADPFGETLPNYLVTYQRIARAIDGLSSVWNGRKIEIAAARQAESPSLPVD